MTARREHLHAKHRMELFRSLVPIYIYFFKCIGEDNNTDANYQDIKQYKRHAQRVFFFSYVLLISNPTILKIIYYLSTTAATCIYYVLSIII
jgi:hypothetical protein